MSTLQDRMKERMAALGLTNAQLAVACGVRPPTSFHWASGKTKNIKGEPLLVASKVLGVRPEWLASGVGPKYSDNGHQNSEHEIHSPIAGYITPQAITDPFIQEAVKMLTALKKSQREGAVANLKLYISHLGPPRYGQTLSVAG